MAAPKVALVTAGSAGLGAAVARMLALDLGMSVVINYSKNAERAQALLADLRAARAAATAATAKAAATPGPAPVYHAVQADLSKRAEVVRLVDEAAAAAGGRLDVVVSNVGWTRVRSFMDLDDNMEEADWDACFGVNVKSHLWLFHAARPYLEASHARDAGGAVFVSTASTAGVKPSGSSLPYAVSKAAQIHLIKSLAVVAAPAIRVNSVSPGLLLTDWGLSFPQDKIDAITEASKLKRVATVEDVAAQVKAFVESKAATAQNAVIDGGFTL